MPAAATPEATRALAARFRGRFAPSSYRDLGRTGLAVSALGFGCYRIDDEREPHVSVLKDALRRGVNLVDTSTNYTDGGSERAVGRSIRELVEAGELRREEVVVVTKAGYVQGRNLAHAQQREQHGRPFPDMVKYADGCWHCLHPEFLADQLERSMQRLGLGSVDVLLLHNPEYFLSDAEHRRTGSLGARREEFYGRIRGAFRALEDMADAGRIAWYGVSSNTFVVPEHDAEATSLARMLEIAGDVAEEAGRSRRSHRFAVAQMPVNLVETGAARERNNPGGRTALEVASEAGVAVLVNRPLNAIVGGSLVRLADWPARAAGTTLLDAARRVEDLERDFATAIAPALQSGGAPELFRWGAELRESAGRFRDALHWRQVESGLVRPRIEHALSHVELHLAGRARNDWTEWAPRYRAAIEVLLGAVADTSRAPAQDSSDAVRARVAPALPDAWRARSLSQQALGVLLGTSGVSSVLVGMREPRWVDDALAALEAEPPGGLDAT